MDDRYEAYSGRFYMRGGWRSFCVANGKKPRDLVNFKLVKNDETPVLQLFPLNLQEIGKIPRYVYSFIFSQGKKK